MTEPYREKKINIQSPTFNDRGELKYDSAFFSVYSTMYSTLLSTKHVKTIACAKTSSQIRINAGIFYFKRSTTKIYITHDLPLPLTNAMRPG